MELHSVGESHAPRNIRSESGVWRGQPDLSDEPAIGPTFHVQRSEGQPATMAGHANEYMAKIGDGILEQIKKRVYLNRIALSHRRQHLMLNQQRLETVDAIADEIPIVS